MRGTALSLAAIWRDLPGFTRDGRTCGSKWKPLQQGETVEIQVATIAAPRPSLPKQLPSSIQKEATTKWTGPRIVEVAVGLEINSYARA
jgi:coenzyme PQQ precursor peptide PqqA